MYDSGNRYNFDIIIMPVLHHIISSTWFGRLVMSDFYDWLTLTFEIEALDERKEQ
jgi:hypothetical protein